RAARGRNLPALAGVSVQPVLLSRRDARSSRVCKPANRTLRPCVQGWRDRRYDVPRRRRRETRPLRVAAVFWGPQAGEGGSYTFRASILHGLQELSAESTHEFVYYVTAGSEEWSRGVLRIPYTRSALYRRAAISQVRSMLDRAGLPRRGPRTWLERSL